MTRGEIHDAESKIVFLQNDEWTPLANLLVNLIAKYADVLNIDSLPLPQIPLEESLEAVKADSQCKNMVVKLGVA